MKIKDILPLLIGGGISGSLGYFLYREYTKRKELEEKLKKMVEEKLKEKGYTGEEEGFETIVGEATSKAIEYVEQGYSEEEAVEKATEETTKEEEEVTPYVPEEEEVYVPEEAVIGIEEVKVE